MKPYAIEFGMLGIGNECSMVMLKGIYVLDARMYIADPTLMELLNKAETCEDSYASLKPV